MGQEAATSPREALAIEVSAADERRVMAAVDAVARTHAGRPVEFVIEVLRRQLEEQGLDGWRAHDPAMAPLLRQVSERDRAGG